MNIHLQLCDIILSKIPSLNAGKVEKLIKYRGPDHDGLRGGAAAGYVLSKATFTPGNMLPGNKQHVEGKINAA